MRASQSKTILVLGQNEELQQSLKTCIRGTSYKICTISNLGLLDKSLTSEPCFIIAIHQKVHSDGFALLNAVRHKKMDAPSVAFVSEANMEVLKLSCATKCANVETLPAEHSSVLAVLEQYCPGFCLAPIKKPSNAPSSGIIGATGIASVMLASNLQLPMQQQDQPVQLPNVPTIEQTVSAELKIYMQMLGQTGVIANGKRITSLTPMQTSLLAYLIYEGEGKVFKTDALARTFWANTYFSDRTAALGSLKATISHIRKALQGITGLQKSSFFATKRNSGQFWLEAGLGWASDVHEFRKLANKIYQLQANHAPIDIGYRAVQRQFFG
jgi:hypothetical protein